MGPGVDDTPTSASSARKRYLLRLEPVMWDRLEHMAKHRAVFISVLIRAAVAEFLDNQDRCDGGSGKTRGTHPRTWLGKLLGRRP